MLMEMQLSSFCQRPGNYEYPLHARWVRRFQHDSSCISTTTTRSTRSRSVVRNPALSAKVKKASAPSFGLLSRPTIMRVLGPANALRTSSSRNESPNIGANIQSHAMITPGGCPLKCSVTRSFTAASSHSRVTPRTAASCGLALQPSSASAATAPRSVSTTGAAPRRAQTMPGSPKPQPSSSTLSPSSEARHASLLRRNSVACTAESQISVPVHEPSLHRGVASSATSGSSSAIGLARCAMNAGSRISHHSALSPRPRRRTETTAVSRSTPTSSGSMQPFATSF
mmetsp:Transcript_43205/g.107484  ORF Transcript_43205/g.107484 Transcript_43205/m.107484 type:complete len:284 (+) Transcript_43205:171-1022(+)